MDELSYMRGNLGVFKPNPIVRLLYKSADITCKAKDGFRDMRGHFSTGPVSLKWLDAQTFNLRSSFNLGLKGFCLIGYLIFPTST